MAQPKICIRVPNSVQDRLDQLLPWGTKNRILSLVIEALILDLENPASGRDLRMALEERRVKITPTQRRRNEV